MALKQMKYLLVVIFVTSLHRLSAAQEDVRQPPAITSNQSSLVIFRTDQTIYLKCSASGTPKPMYDWMRNNAPLNQNVMNIRRRFDGDIDISNAGALDEGYYQCVASNLYGKALSNGTLLQRAFQSEPGQPIVHEMTVNEGEPFRVQIHPLKSSPRAQYTWATADKAVATDQNQILLQLSRRIQWDEDGDLHFAFATPDDALNGRIYKSLTYNRYADIISGGSYTRVTVKPVRGGARPFSPVSAFSSHSPTVGLEGETVAIRCFFSANPEADILWTGPKNSLPIGRYDITNFNTEFKISNFEAKDEGDYVCKGTNNLGEASQTIKILHQAVPVFRSASDGPQNTNITEGFSTTFNCNAYAKPDATIAWMKNGEPLDLKNLPHRISVSADHRTLTVKKVCRDCLDDYDDRNTDLMVIQCNASNHYGYAYGSGYLNVLRKTEVRLTGRDEVTIDINNSPEGSVQFHCVVTHDPSTPAEVRWFRLLAGGELQRLRSHSPEVLVVNDVLTITVDLENSTDGWKKYTGRYQCIGSSAYSSDTSVVTIQVIDKDPLFDDPKDAAFPWWIFLLIAVIVFLFILIVFCCVCLFRNRGNKYDVDGRERKNGNDPVKELSEAGFHDYQRREVQPLKGSRVSLTSSARDASDYGDASRNHYTSNGSFHSASFFDMTDRKIGRSEMV